MPRIRVRITIRWAMLLVAASAGVFALLVAVGDAKEAQRRSECVNNLKMIGLALHNFHSANDVLPPGTEPGSLPPERRLGWRIRILSYLEQFRCSPQFDRESAWDSATNLATVVPERDCRDDEGGVYKVTYRRIPSYDCPCHKDAGNPKLPASSPFVGIAGIGADAASLPKGHIQAGIFGNDRQTKFEEITDGLANTMMVAETTRDIGPWTAGGRASIRGVDPDHPPYIGGKKGQFGGSHPGGANVLMADGSVKFVKQTIAPKTFEALATIAGGEPVRADLP